MEKATSQKNNKASIFKPIIAGKPPSRDKTFGVETEICIYEVEDGDKTKEVEEAEILVVHN